MPYLIDGHNLIPHVPGLSLAAIDDEQELINRLVDFCRRTGKKPLEVFFDRAPVGFAGSRRYGAVTARFVAVGSTADAAIRRRLAQLGSAARGWTVVTSDRQVQAEARQAGAQVQTAPEFAQLLANSAPAPETGRRDREIGLTAEEIQDWLDMFGGDGNK